MISNDFSTFSVEKGASDGYTNSELVERVTSAHCHGKLLLELQFMDFPNKDAFKTWSL